MTITDPGTARAFELLDEIDELNRQIAAKAAELSDVLGQKVPRGDAGGDGSAAVASSPPDELDLALDDMGRLLREHLVTADSMNPDGWMRPTGGLLWRQVADVTKCASGQPCRCISFRDGGESLHVDPYTTYPYLSAAEFDADCEQEQTEAVPMARLIEDQAAMDALAQRELQQERAKDFGHDDPAAA